MDKKALLELRKLSNNRIGLADCRKALEEANGDLDEAKKLLGIDQGKKRFAFFDFPMPTGATPPPSWFYILAKCTNYLKLGPEIYRRGDALGLPDADLGEEELQEVASCFQQFLDGRGYERDKPVEGVGIHGFYEAMRTLHFERVEQSASQVGDGDMLDEILFRHVVDGREVTLFNLVKY